MPEEHNRRVADHLSSLLLVHSRGAEENLAREGIAGDHVVLVGNTMIDALVANVRKARRLAVWRRLGLRAGGYVLVTLHRPALVDTPELLARTMAALGAVARELPVVFPVHPRTLVRLRELGQAEDERVLLLEPQPYRRFLSLEAGAAAVVTDSGGVQEETTALGVPCFTLRNNTERPVTSPTARTRCSASIQSGSLTSPACCRSGHRGAGCRRSGTDEPGPGSRRDRARAGRPGRSATRIPKEPSAPSCTRLRPCPHSRLGSSDD